MLSPRPSGEVLGVRGIPQSSIYNPTSSKGFTLVEMIIVIVITGIIGGIVAIFIKAPVQGYVDSARRAELTDIADTAVRRMARDIRTAVPNSVRTTGCGATPCVEFLPTKDGGRYRADTPGNVLTFGSADGTFDIVGTAITFAAGDYIVVGSTQSTGNLPYDTTATGVLRSYTSLAGLTVTMNSTLLPTTAALDSQRFDVVDGAQQAVTYACEGTLGTLDTNNNGQGRLVKHWGYGFNAAQVVPGSLGGTSAILADKVSACAIDYDLPNQRFGLVAVRLTLTSGGESVTLYNEIHVNNSP
ncbi:MAG: prepilin-type N-terminal cleavage/methylation domain-containing protein [Sideroxyarcus sp.]|nr:prepilin-type N-terminal cleavage/methylation domain-containing protein [Sideroxyarcus sp.]